MALALVPDAFVLTPKAGNFYLNLVSQSDEDLSTGPRSSKRLRGGAEFHWSVIFLRMLNFC